MRGGRNWTGRDKQMNKKCLWCVHDTVLEDNDGKRLHVCVNRRSGKFLEELDILEDGCGGFEEERFKEE